jgi:hypothetical protein
LATCGEKIALEPYGIQHNCCVDDDLMIRFAHHDKALMDFLAHPQRDKGQRQFCGCMVSKDIGEYNTCPHLCEYCYANASKEKAVENYKRHEINPWMETITKS